MVWNNRSTCVKSQTSVFNVAKRLEIDADGSTLPSNIECMSGTVEFMSPEMIECTSATTKTGMIEID